MKNGETVVAGGLIFMLLVGALLLSPVLGALTMPYAVNTWLEFFGKDPTFVWWYGALLGIIPTIGQWSVLAAIITIVASFFM